MFELVCYTAFITLCAYACRAHGKAIENTMWPTWGRLACKILFGIVGFITSYITLSSAIQTASLSTEATITVISLLLVTACITVAALSTGHGRFFGMAGANPADSNKEWIETYVVSKFYKGNEFEPKYSFICMAVKGFGIGLSLFPTGLLLTYAWPKAYQLSIKYTKDTLYAEYATGACFGIATVLNVAIFGA
jgi:hypothetical protein